MYPKYEVKNEKVKIGVIIEPNCILNWWLNLRESNFFVTCKPSILTIHP